MRKIASRLLMSSLFVFSFFLGEPGPAIALDPGCAALNSTKVCPPPSLPTLPAAGKTFTDPTFGTTILRVTDQNDGNDNCHLYASFWPAFNWNSTAFWIKYNSSSPAAVSLYTFNPTTLAIQRLNAAQTSMWGGGTGLQDDTMQWHRGSDHPNRIYGFGYGSNSTNLYQVDLDLSAPYSPSNNTWTLIKAFGSWMDYMTMSADNDYFAFLDGPAGNTTVAKVYQRSTDKTWTHDFAAQGFSSLHAIMIDKSGKYVLAAQGAGSPWYLWKFATNTITRIDYDATDRGVGHRAIGDGKLYQVDAYNGDTRHVIARDLTSNADTNWYYMMLPPTGGGSAQEGYTSAFPTD